MDWKVGVSPGEMVFGNSLSLGPKMSGYEKAQILRNTIMIKTEGSEFRAISVPALTLTRSLTLGDRLNLGSQFSHL